MQESDRYTLVKYHKDSNVLMITIREAQLDSVIADDLKKRLKYHSDNYIKKYSIENIIVSLRHVKSIDSTGVGALLSLWKHLAFAGNVKLSLCQCPQVALNFIQLCKLDHIFDIAETEESALAAVNNNSFATQKSA